MEYNVDMQILAFFAKIKSKQMDTSRELKNPTIPKKAIEMFPGSRFYGQFTSLPPSSGLSHLHVEDTKGHCKGSKGGQQGGLRWVTQLDMIMIKFEERF